MPETKSKVEKNKDELKCLHCGKEMQKDDVVCEYCKKNTCRVSDKIDNTLLWQSICSMWDTEANRFWARNNIFILVNSGLLAVQTSVIEGATLKILLAIVGIIFVAIWIQINRLGKFYLDRWKLVAACVEEKLDIAILTALPSKKPASTKKFEIVLWVFLVVWVILIILSVFTVITKKVEIETSNFTSKGAVTEWHINYHIVMPVNYKRAISNKDYIKEIVKIILDVAGRYQFNVQAIGCDIENIHLLCNAHPNITPERITQVLKERIQNELLKLKPSIKNELGDGDFWSYSSYISTVEKDAQWSAIEEYVKTKNQDINQLKRLK